MPPGHPPTARPPGGQAGHPDLESLADLDAGLTDPATTARLTQHVGSCPTCAAVLSALGAVRADLRALPPPPLPDPVAARLDTTLALLRGGPARVEPSGSAAPDGVERSAVRPGPAPPTVPSPPAVAASRSDGTRSGGTRSGGTRAGGSQTGRAGAGVADLAAARERRRDRIRRWTTLVAASAVVLAAIVGIGTAVLRGGGRGSSISSGAAVVPDSAPSRGGDAGSGGAGGAAGTAQPQHRTEGQPATKGPAALPLAVPAYSRTTLAGALPEFAQRGAIGGVAAGGVGSPSGAMADSGLRARCASSIPAAPGQPIAVLKVLFENQPGYVFVYGQPGQPRGAVVVADDCGTGTGQATVLYRLPG